jgi:hypothetical protein
MAGTSPAMTKELIRFYLIEEIEIRDEFAVRPWDVDGRDQPGHNG